MILSIHAKSKHTYSNGSRASRSALGGYADGGTLFELQHGRGQATEISGRAFHPGDSAFYSMVSENFVRASGIRLLKRRNPVPDDEATSAMEVLVNEAFLNKYFG